MKSKIEITEYGSVELFDRWGSDASIAMVTRGSTGSGNKGQEADRKLFKTLLRDNHGSPLEFGGLVFKLKMPLYLVAQLQRHRMASYSQKSARYVEMEMTFHRPKKWRTQSKINRQMSDSEIEDQGKANEAFDSAIAAAVNAYAALLDLGVSREQARVVLPVATETELYVQMNLRSLMNFLQLRVAKDAQGEMRVYAEDMQNIFKIQFPLLHDLFEVMCEVGGEQKEERMKLWNEKVSMLTQFEEKRREYWETQLEVY